MFEIKTVMTTDVVAVKKTTRIEDAIRILVQNDVTGLPVVNDDMTLAGIITEKDMLKLLYYYEDRPYTVQDLMTENVVCFDQEDDLVNVCECLIHNHFRRVPILANGKLVGIISKKDIIANIAEYQGFFRDPPNKVKKALASLV